MPGAVDLLTSYDRRGIRWGSDLVPARWRWPDWAPPGCRGLRSSSPPTTSPQRPIGLLLSWGRAPRASKRHCLVVEDAAAGVRAGQAAGMTVAGARDVASADLDLGEPAGSDDGRGPLRTRTPCRCLSDPRTLARGWRCP